MWIASRRYQCFILFCLWIFLFVSRAVGETQEKTKSWNLAIITGSFTDKGKARYYIQPQINFVDDKYKFQNGFFYLGLGYELNHDSIVWMMAGYNYIKRPDGRIRRLDLLRQQMDWRLFETSNFVLGSNTRLEERKDTKETGWAVRIREKLTLRIPFKDWEGHSFFVADEIFLDLNHPEWIHSNTFLEQNRASIGIGTTLSKYAFLDVGYTNQYQMREENVMSNVIYLGLNVALI